MRDLQQGSGLGQDDPRAEIFVDIRSAEVGLKFANNPSRRNRDTRCSSMGSGDGVLDLGSPEGEQRRELGRSSGRQDLGVVEMRDGRSVDDERDRLEEDNSPTEKGDGVINDQV